MTEDQFDLLLKIIDAKIEEYSARDHHYGNGAERGFTEMLIDEMRTMIARAIFEQGEK